MDYKRRLFEIVEPPRKGDYISRAFDIFILTLIALNVIGMIIESVPTVSVVLLDALKTFEFISVIIFTVEYAARLWTCTLNPSFSQPVLGRLKFAFTFMALIDILAIIPFWLPMFIVVDLRFLRAFRLLRITRLVKMGRYSKSLQVIATVLKKKKSDLITTVAVGFLLLLIASCLVFECERKAQPELFSSIPATMWWGVTTLTTVGYGDIYPVTLMGKIFAAIIACAGVGMFALPTAILGAAFLEELQGTPAETSCPHCGKAINKNTES